MAERKASSDIFDYEKKETLKSETAGLDMQKHVINRWRRLRDLPLPPS